MTRRCRAAEARPTAVLRRATAVDAHGTSPGGTACRRVHGPLGRGGPQADGLGSHGAVRLESRDHLGRDRPAQQRLDVTEERRLVDADERDRLPVRARTPGPPDAVDVVLRDHRQLEVDDVGELLDVQASSRDVRRHEDGDAALLEVGQRLDALGLALVAVDRGGVDAVLDQLLRQAVRTVLGAGEDQRLVDAPEGDELAEQVALSLAVDGDHQLVDQLRGGVARRDLDEGRGREDPGGQRPDVVRERGTEQQVLAPRREEVDDPADVADEAHVQEAVCLVQDQDLDAAQVDGPLGDVVEQAARGGHHDLGTGAKPGRLGLEADAAVDGRRLDRAAGAVGAHALLDLEAELPGRDDHEDADRRARGGGGRT